MEKESSSFTKFASSVIDMTSVIMEVVLILFELASEIMEMASTLKEITYEVKKRFYIHISTQKLINNFKINVESTIFHSFMCFFIGINSSNG